MPQGSGSGTSDLKEDGADNDGITRPDRPGHPRLAPDRGPADRAEVGRRVGLSQPAASERIQRLEKNGVITHRLPSDSRRGSHGLNVATGRARAGCTGGQSSDSLSSPGPFPCLR
ncbi:MULTISPECIES: winged helix-turn-helix transcriptional regulator [Streptomyces]|uniref:Winged helix-turn-helix transcriptional regulator n=1 Tax=Streptomyces flaveolus TaxID=67297 RepID=A0ABV3AHW2_9ACTN|nr:MULTISPECIES: winged helix-turn-helix transcriptional regulator [Streptomyces]